MWISGDTSAPTIPAGWVKNYAKGSGYWAFVGEYTIRPRPNLRIDLEYQQLSHFSLMDHGSCG